MQIPRIWLPLRRSPSVQHWRLARRGGGWAAEVCIIRQTIRVLQQLPAVCRTMARPIQTFMVVVSQIVLLQWFKFAAGSVTYSSNRALCPVGWIVLMKLIATSLVDNSKLWQIACVAPLTRGNSVYPIWKDATLWLHPVKQHDPEHTMWTTVAAMAACSRLASQA